MIDIRLAVPAAAAWGGLVLALPNPELLPALAGTAGAVGAACVVAAVVLRGGSRRAGEGADDRAGGRARAAAVVTAAAGLAASAVAAVALSAVLGLPARQPPELAHPTTATAVGRVTSAPDRGAGRLRILVSSLTVRGVTRHVALPVLVSDVEPTDGREPALHDTVEVRGRLAPADAGGDLGGFLAASSPPRVVAPAGGLPGAAARLRQSYVQVARVLPGDGGALLPGLSVGDTSAVDESLDSAMTSSGLSHLTAVSGANCAVVVGGVLMVGAALGIGRIARSIAAAMVLVGFVVLVTPEPSVVRAAVMALVGLTLGVLGRPVRLLPLISLTVLGLLLWDPWLARSYAFALSVLATSGLAVLAGPLTRILTRILPEPLALALSVPIAAQLACQPLLLSIDPGLPLVSVAANLLSEPAAPIATVVGGVACLLSPLWPGGALVVAGVAWLPAAWIAAVARFFSALPHGQLDWGGSAPAIGLAAALTVLASAVLLTTPFRRSRRVASIALVAVALPVVTTVGGGELGRSASFPGDWRMVQCDVGQGDAVLIRSEGRVSLIDTGDDERLLAACLARAGVQRIDLLVLTHFDRDHVGAAGSLAGRVDDLMIGPTDGAADERLVATLRATHVIEAGPGVSVRLGELSLDALWPPARTSPGNEASVVLGVRPITACDTCLTALLLGDLGETEQKRLLGRTALGPVDVVKVSHHGSRDQDPVLYEAIQARVALIGVGAHNTYGHPTPETLRLLARTGSRVLRSDRDGTVALSTTPGRTGERPGIDVWEAGERNVSAAAPRLEPGLPIAGRPEEGHGCQRSDEACRGQGARRDRPGLVGAHPARPGRARLRARAVPRRSRDPSAP